MHNIDSDFSLAPRGIEKSDDNIIIEYSKCAFEHDLLRDWRTMFKTRPLCDDLRHSQ